MRRFFPLLVALAGVAACDGSGVPRDPSPEAPVPPPRVPTDPPGPSEVPPDGEPGLGDYGDACDGNADCASALCLEGGESEVASCSRSCALDDVAWCNEVGAWCRPVDAQGTLACDGALPVDLGDDVEDGGSLLPGDVRASRLDVGDADLYRLEYRAPPDRVQVAFRPTSGVLPQLTVYDVTGAEVEGVRFAGLGGILTATFVPFGDYGWVVIENLGDDPAGYTVSLAHRGSTL